MASESLFSGQGVLVLVSLVLGIAVTGLLASSFLISRRRDLLWFLVAQVGFSLDTFSNSFIHLFLLRTLTDPVASFLWGRFLYDLGMAILFVAGTGMIVEVAELTGPARRSFWLGPLLALIPLGEFVLEAIAGVDFGQAQALANQHYNSVLVLHYFWLVACTVLVAIRWRRVEDPFRRFIGLLLVALGILWTPLQTHYLFLSGQTPVPEFRGLIPTNLFFIGGTLGLGALVVVFFLGKRPPFFRVNAQTIANVAKLSAREREVLELVEQGNLNKEISALLHISESTVKNHLYSAYRKLGVTNRTRANFVMREAKGQEA